MKFLLIYVPNLRFNGYTENWQKYRTIELGKMQRGKSKHRPRDDEKLYGGTYPFIQTGDIKKANLYIREYERTYSNYGLSQSKLWSKGTLCITIAANIAETAILGLNACFPDSVIGWISNDKITNNIFIKYYFDFYKTQLKRLSVGGAQENLNLDKLENVYFNIPTLSEQNDITNLLTKIDELIDTQSKIIDDLLTVKNGISNKLFKLQQIELSNHYLFEYLTEGDKTAVDTSCYKKITVKLNNQGLAFSELNREMADTRPFYVRHKGELIIGKQNYFNGSIAIVTEQFDNCICSNAIMSFKIKDIDSDFLYYQISNNNYLNSQSYKANGTGQKELSEKEFLNFKIWCPQLEVQQKIVNCFKSLDLKIENEKAILNSYFQEKSYLLNNMFI